MSRRQFIKGMAALGGAELGGGLLGVSVSDFLKSFALQEEAETMRSTGQVDKAQDLQVQSNKLSSTAIKTGVPGTIISGTSFGIILKELFK